MQILISYLQHKCDRTFWHGFGKASPQQKSEEGLSFRGLSPRPCKAALRDFRILNLWTSEPEFEKAKKTWEKKAKCLQTYEFNRRCKRIPLHFRSNGFTPKPQLRPQQTHCPGHLKLWEVVPNHPNVPPRGVNLKGVWSVQEYSSRVVGFTSLNVNLRS